MYERCMEFRCVDPGQANAVGSMLHCLLWFFKNQGNGRPKQECIWPQCACTSAFLMCQWMSLDGLQHWRSQLSNPKQIPSEKGGLILMQDGHRHLPSQSTTELHGPTRHCQRPLFMLEDGSFLTHHYFVSAVRDVLQRVGIDQLKYCGHSFRTQ